MNNNKLAIVLVLSILVNGSLLGCSRVDNAATLDEIETTTFAIEEAVDAVQEYRLKKSKNEDSTSATAKTTQTERLNTSSLQATQTASITTIIESDEQISKTTSTTGIVITEESKTTPNKPNKITVENTTTIPEKTESTKSTAVLPTTKATSVNQTPSTVLTPATEPEFYNRVDTATFIQQAFAEVNRMRAEVGQDPVIMAPKLVQDYTMLRAKEEGSEGSAFHFDHQRPNGEFALDYLQYLYYDGVLENIAISENISTVGVMESYSHFGDGMVRSFHDSIDHYNNIISPDAGSVGIGYYYNEEVWLPYIVLIFLEKS